LLRRLCLERDMALLLVTHDPEAAAYADHTHELRDGRLTKCDSPLAIAAFHDVPGDQGL
jgi:ABC-type lipoprotein export system ATPase subunit